MYSPKFFPFFWLDRKTVFPACLAIDSCDIFGPMEFGQDMLFPDLGLEMWQTSIFYG